LPVVFEEEEHPAKGGEVDEEDVCPEKVGVFEDIENTEALDFSRVAAGGIVYWEEDDADDDAVEETELESHLEEAEEHDCVEADVVDVKLLWDAYCGHDPSKKL
jgi:hypothetical protein